MKYVVQELKILTKKLTLKSEFIYFLYYVIKDVSFLADGNIKNKCSTFYFVVYF